MTWFKVDDGFAFHPKTLAVGNQALGLWVRAGSWCGQQLTNGHVPEAMIYALGGTVDDAKALAAEHLWHVPGDECEVCEAQGTLPFEAGYQFHDWCRMQPSRADKEAERTANRERQRKWRERQQVRDEQTGRYVSNGVTDGVSNTSPDPTRPDP